MTQPNNKINVNSEVASPALDSLQVTRLAQAVSDFSKEQLVWASGYLAGLSAANLQPLATTHQAQNDINNTVTVTVLYGSQTGNAKHEAAAFSKLLGQDDIKTNLISMADFKPRKIKDETHLVIFVSTHGEGDAPDDAVELHEFLASKKAPKLTYLEYAVVALGDSSYEFFCQTGKDFDGRLQALGAKPIEQRLDCDVDYAEDIANWSKTMTSKLVSALKPIKEAQATNVNAQSLLNPNEANTNYTKQNPFLATLLDSFKITGRDSIKDIRHIEISLEDSGISYKAGDSLGVYFSNCPKLVERVIQATQTDGDESVVIKDTKCSLREALSDKLELTLSYPGFVKNYQHSTNDQNLKTVLDDKAALRTFLEERQIVDIVEQFPNKITAQTLVDALRQITPRLYSIASSQNEVEDEVHLTVAHVDYEAFGTRHQGGASGFLASRLEEGAQVQVFVENNDNFRLPVDPETPIIMVGPGTGIAPFRAFMQEREASGANGKNWLFFGNPSFTQDFLYQVEWQSYVKNGLLNKVSLAFSRDQAEKIYVQDRLIENAKEVYQWLQQGAHFYVCGDAMKMAKDVEQALLNIIQQEGNKDLTEAKKYLLEMRKSKRYQKDVY